jgi:hypothetical protein
MEENRKQIEMAYEERKRKKQEEARLNEPEKKKDEVVCPEPKSIDLVDEYEEFLLWRRRQAKTFPIAGANELRLIDL